MRTSAKYSRVKSLKAAGRGVVRFGSRKAGPQAARLNPAAIVALRGRLGLSQEGFASALGISVDTLQNWEQGRRRPTGPAKVLLAVASRHPEAVVRAVA